MRLVFVGGGFSNKGAEAMLKTTAGELEARLGRLEVVLYASDPAECGLARQAGYVPHCLRFGASKISKARFLIASGLRHPVIFKSSGSSSLLTSALVSAKALRLVEGIGSFDGIVDISGLAYCDAFGVLPTLLTGPLVAGAGKMHAPVVFMPQAWGPFATPGLAPSVRAMEQSARCRFYARDEESFGYLSRAVGPGSISSEISPDVAFTFRSSSSKRVSEILQGVGWRKERPLVAIAPNMRAYSRTRGTGLENEHLSGLMRAAHVAIHELGADVLLQANEIRTDASRADDRHLCRLLHSALGRPERCFFHPGYLSAEDSAGLIGACELLLGSRFHSLVFGLSQGVACVAVGWSHKYRELLKPFGLQDMVVDVYAFSQADTADLLRKAWAGRVAARHRIVPIVDGYRHKNARLFDEVAALLSGARCGQ